ncbi:dNA polymerase III gamma/tau subunits [Acetobacter sp. CAG:267]|nr:dNA polymerase III gamma/tau subunits [Acetobacter sp. CAG:267]
MAEENTNENQYVVLARKYRPQNFEDLLGQDALVQTLTNAIQNNRLHHAYILTGIRGVGKTTTARLIARALNCTGADGKGGPTIHPCGVCDNCKAIAAGRHMDVMELDAASHTGVDDIRELLDSARYAPTNARYKVYIIDEVHMLSKGAFNALLKTLEEPPAHVKFIFATTEIRKVPVTILSRCQRFDLQRLSVETLTQLFTKILANENIPAETEALDIIAKAADGSARDGLSLLDQAIVLSNGNINTDVVKKMLGLADRSQTLTLFENLVNGNMEAVLKDISEQYTNGATPMIVLQDLINITHDLAKVKIIPALLNSTSLSEIEKKTFATLSTSCSLAVLSKIWQMLIKGISEINMAPSAVEALEMILLRVAYSASLPTPYEILNEVKKNSDLAGTGSVYSGQSALLQNSAAAAPVSVPPSGTEKKNDLTATVSAGETSGFNTVEDFLHYLEGTKKALIEYSIKHDVCIREFSDGHIAMNIAPAIHQDFIMNLHKLLSEATGRQWEIEIIKGDLGETIADKEKSAAEATKKNVSEYPLVKKILEEFKGAKIETVIRKNLEELAENEPDIPGDTVPVTYFEEEE